VKKTLVKLNPDPTGSQDYGPCGVSPLKWKRPKLVYPKAREQ
jgi:hypothetical protein